MWSGGIVKIHLIKGGYCTHPEFVVAKGGTFAPRIFPASVVVIEHPKIGVILFDTGYSRDFHKHTKQFPEKLYALTTPTYIEPETTAAAQLEKVGINASDVKVVILSHFHADHMGGVADFPHAKYLYLSHAYESLKHLSRFKKVLAGFLSAALPGDFENRSQFVDNTKKSENILGPGFLQGFDLFDDGSVFALELPGHVPGQIGIYLPHATLDKSDRDQEFFFVADACWLSKNYLHQQMPSPIVRLVMHDYSEYSKTLDKLRHLHEQRPGLAIVPCHCSDTLDQIIHPKPTSK